MRGKLSRGGRCPSHAAVFRDALRALIAAHRRLLFWIFSGEQLTFTSRVVHVALSLMRMSRFLDRPNGGGKPLSRFSVPRDSAGGRVKLMG